MKSGNATLPFGTRASAAPVKRYPIETVILLPHLSLNAPHSATPTTEHSSSTIVKSPVVDPKLSVGTLQTNDEKKG